MSENINRKRRFVTSANRRAVLGRSRRATAPVVTLLIALLGAALLAGCSDDADDDTAAQSMTINDQWVKAAPQGEMTALFGELANDSYEEIRVVSASSPAAGRMEIHEVVADTSGDMVMQEKDGGFVIPASSTLPLTPGGDHLMLFDLPEPITPGQDITVELAMSDGSIMTFSAQARDFPGADESYHNHGDAGSMTDDSGA